MLIERSNHILSCNTHLAIRAYHKPSGVAVLGAEFQGNQVE
jgi:hypothetical protein